jgi:Helix-turn-helix domain
MRGKRAWIKLDRYEPLHLIREQHLSASEFTLLVVLVLLADYETGEWTGTRRDLAEESGLDKTTVHRACDGLVGRGLIHMLKDFGPNRAGIVHIDSYCALVKDCTPGTLDRHAIVLSGQNSENSPVHDHANGDETATNWRLIGDDKASSRRFTRENDTSLGSEAERECGSGTPDLCLHCGEKIEGHPYTDHEPVRATLGKATMLGDELDDQER